MALTGKQAAFVEAYLVHRNKTQAAKDAGYDGDYWTLAAIGYENFKKPQIAEAISQRISESCMTADEVLERLGDQARGDVKEFFGTQEDGTPFFDYRGALKLGKTHLIKKMKTKKKTYTQKGDRDTFVAETEVEFELYDAQSALVQIGRHHGLFVDKTELTGKGGAPLLDIDKLIDKVYGKSDGNSNAE